MEIDYKYLSTETEKSSLIKEIQPKNDEDPDYLFQSQFAQFLEIAENHEYVELMPSLEGMNELLSQYKSTDVSIIYKYDIFTIFFDLISNYINEEENYFKASKLVSGFIKLIFVNQGSIVAEVFSSMPLCKLFVENMNIPIFNLFSIIIGVSEKVNQNLVNFGIIDQIPNNENPDFLKTKFLLFSNYCLFCDLNDFSNCTFVINECIDNVYEENDDECYEYRIIAICRSIRRSKEISDFLVAKDIIGYINKTLTDEQKNKRIQLSLQILEILTTNATDCCRKKLKNDLPLPLLLQKLSIPDVEIGKKVWNCVVNLLCYNDVYDFNQYMKCEFPQLINNTLTNDGSFKMKENALLCVNNFLLLFDCKISAVFNDEMLSNIIESIYYSSFSSQQDVFGCICKIISCIIIENKFIFFEKIDEFLKHMYDEAENDHVIAEKCDALHQLLEAQANKSSTE